MREGVAQEEGDMTWLGWSLVAIGAAYLIAMLVAALWMRGRKRPDEDTTENGHD